MLTKDNFTLEHVRDYAASSDIQRTGAERSSREDTDHRLSDIQRPEGPSHSGKFQEH